ncbi:HlyD family efflux transporter periplasmic adaptor subunit [Vescimonas sp.]|uniref:HlyD family efflux transporter periplasmic adaptor subunit n=1 Tax=Vescimonas sp. TaxID=2892404 RepID=UPI00307C5E26
MRSTPIFKILSLAVLVAVVTLLGIEGYRYFHRSVSVSVAYTGQVTDSLSVTGWVVRQETPLPDTSGTLLRQVQEGEKVHAGQTVAMAYASKSALEVVSRLEDTELKLQQLQFARSSFLDSDAALKVDSDISDSILRLHIATADGDYATATQEMSAMKTAVLKRSYSYESLEQIDQAIAQTRSDISTLQNQLSGATSVKTAVAGVYSGSTDGSEETLTPDFLTDVTPARLDALSTGSAVKSAGKIITDNTWYFAANIPAQQARELQVGQEVTLRLSKGLQQDTPAYVQSISAEEDGQVAVVLSCTRYISQVTLLRHQQGEILLREYKGLRVPSAALRMDEDGSLQLFCRLGAYVYSKPVDLVYRGDGFCLVRSAQGAADERILRQGDLVISTARALTDGMIFPDN